MLDLYKLYIFTLVVEEGSFSGAAERLSLTQSAVSQHIQQLEKGYGTQLFWRGRRGVQPTAAGHTLHDYAQQILHLAAEAETAITDVANLASGQVTIGATPGISVYLLPEMVQSFRAQYPKLNITLQTNITPQIVEALHSKRLDLGFVEGELAAEISQKLTVLELQAVPQWVMVGPKHPWWGRPSLAMGELNEQNMVLRQPASQTRKWLTAMFEMHGVQPHIVAEFDNVESIKRAVIMGNCLTILPLYTIEQEQALAQLHAIPLDGNPLTRHLKLVWPKGWLLSPIAKAFVRHVEGKF